WRPACSAAQASPVVAALPGAVAGPVPLLLPGPAPASPMVLEQRAQPPPTGCALRTTVRHPHAGTPDAFAAAQRCAGSAAAAAPPAAGPSPVPSASALPSRLAG